MLLRRRSQPLQARSHPATDLTGLKAEQQAEDRFAEARKELLAEGGGVVSIFYHPCEFVHKQFWDGVNFAQGRQPAARAVEAAAAEDAGGDEGGLRELSRRGFASSSASTTCSSSRRRRRRSSTATGRAGRKFTPAELKTIAAAVGDDDHLSAARGLYAVGGGGVRAAQRVRGGARRRADAGRRGVEGDAVRPDQRVAGAAGSGVTTDWSQFGRTAADVADFVASRAASRERSGSARSRSRRRRICGRWRRSRWICWTASNRRRRSRSSRPSSRRRSTCPPTTRSCGAG